MYLSVSLSVFLSAHRDNIAVNLPKYLPISSAYMFKHLSVSLSIYLSADHDITAVYLPLYLNVYLSL